MRKTKEQLVADIVAAGFAVTSNRKEGKTDTGRDKLPLVMRVIGIRIPGALWSQELGDWCSKSKQRANEKRVIALLKNACGKDALFDLCDHDMGHSSEGDAPDDAHCHFYVYTSN